MTQATTDYEARFLELATRPGMEGLRRACQCKNGRALKHILVIDAEYQLWDTDYEECYRCQGRGWLPKPVPERMGALVALCDQVTFIKTGDRASEVELCWEQTFYSGNAPTPEAALVEALLAATQKLVEP